MSIKDPEILLAANQLGENYVNAVNGCGGIGVLTCFNEVKAFIEAGKPVMGICRGYQLLNVYFGGTLCQHLTNASEHRTDGKGDQVHTIKALDGSIASNLYGSKFAVNSSHVL